MAPIFKDPNVSIDNRINSYLGLQNSPNNNLSNYGGFNSAAFEPLNSNVASTLKFPDISTEFLDGALNGPQATTGIAASTMGTMGNLWDKFTGSFKTPLDDKGKATGMSPMLSYGKLGLDAFNAYTGSQQLDLLKQELAQNQKNFSDQFNIQKATTLADLSDRNNARNAANPNTGLGTEEFNNRYKSLA